MRAINLELKMTILLVEDDPGDMFLTRRVLENSRIPLEIVAFSDGNSAIAYLSQDTPYQDAPLPDLIILDLNLPGQDGREVLRRIKSNPATEKIPVVVFSTSDAPRDIKTSYENGANCYVTKPLNLKDYSEVVISIQQYWAHIATLPQNL